MNNSFFDELKSLLEKLPGIGPRQASRFIWALVDFSHEERKKLSSGIDSLGEAFARCLVCHRIYSKTGQEKAACCSFCKDSSKRDTAKIMVVERDNDLVNIEKAKIYDGLYHVLGGALDPLYENGSRERIKSLHQRVQGSSSSVKGGSASGGKIQASRQEVILALSPTKMGEFTASYIEKVLEPLKIKTTRLGRGLSTGIDLEYADEQTLKQSLENRK